MNNIHLNKYKTIIYKNEESIFDQVSKVWGFKD